MEHFRVVSAGENGVSFFLGCLRTECSRLVNSFVYLTLSTLLSTYALLYLYISDIIGKGYVRQDVLVFFAKIVQVFLHI